MLQEETIRRNERERKAMAERIGALERATTAGDAEKKEMSVSRGATSGGGEGCGGGDWWWDGSSWEAESRGKGRSMRNGGRCDHERERFIVSFLTVFLPVFTPHTLWTPLP